uniref:C2H2-type domain-containing protein n=1 Tax=Leptobrachium leishanense TaxID=445787 RepID=A0A8C5WCM1_9ANUR
AGSTQGSPPPPLTGRAAKAYRTVPDEEATNYTHVKQALLSRFAVTPEASRAKFRNSRRPTGATHVEWAHRLQRDLRTWFLGSKAETVTEITQLLLLEQFFEHTPSAIRDQSPDLNPIEMLWHDLKRAIHTRHPKNTATLKQCCEEEWSKITPDRCAESRKPDHRIYYTDLLTHSSVYKGHSAPSSEMGKVSYSESDLVIPETNCTEEPFSYNFCWENSTPESALKYQHIHTERQPFTCPECENHFTDSITLKNHQRTHNGEKKFKCSECEKCFTLAGNLAKHKMIHTGEKPFICSECGKCFTQGSHLSRHKMIHTGEKPFICTECGKCFTMSSQLSVHNRIHTGEKTFNCTECGKCFTVASSLAKHKMIHTKEKPFKCPECGKCFTQSSTLAKHKLIHTGEKPFKCFECGKCFTQPATLAKHKMIHTGEKPFKCSECGNCFTQSSTLATHKIIHTGEKPFKCPECGKCFNHPSHLRKHRKIHTGENPFPGS